eukprot:CAMPEP_0116038380 /NCGR_PEP_ID=MMETSP0321-20121206/22757_1 /TAXON_ID=163516 /ORGANISM="Leptocylindrus danicus var. danicus, Strain B650" /LENGTH=443 /DNA_ID=CAMNT_0003517049 /DNA_START=81 /DNA_END=1412 /DNA_ORIENTATION=-
MPWPTKLHKLVGDDADDYWTEVIRRTQTHPHEAGVQGNYGQTALHVACYRFPPTAAVEAMLRAYPACAVLTNHSGETPLHLATEGASETIQMMILQAGPLAASKRDKYLMCGAGQSSLRMIRSVIEACPDAVHWPSNEGKTPIFKLSRDYESANTVEEVVYGQDWAISNLLLMAAQFGTCNVPPGRRFLVLHAAAMLPCPLSFIRVAASLFPHQTMERDRNGMVPLALAAIAPIYEEPSRVEKVVPLDEGLPAVISNQNSNHDTNDNNVASAQSNNDPSNPQQQQQHQQHSETNTNTNAKPQQTLIELLVAANPNAVHVMNNEGRTPLNLAIASGKRWNQGVSALYHAAPKCLETKDAATGLYSFLLAAISPNPCAETCFHLLQGWPEVVRLGITDDHNNGPPYGNNVNVKCYSGVKRTIIEIDDDDDEVVEVYDGDKKPRAI